jgi:hypothetical protein
MYPDHLQFQMYGGRVLDWNMCQLEFFSPKLLWHTVWKWGAYDAAWSREHCARKKIIKSGKILTIDSFLGLVLKIGPVADKKKIVSQNVHRYCTQRSENLMCSFDSSRCSWLPQSYPAIMDRVGVPDGVPDTGRCILKFKEDPKCTP